jgi:hypothetical protein
MVLWLSRLISCNTGEISCSRGQLYARCVIVQRAAGSWLSKVRFLPGPHGPDALWLGTRVPLMPAALEVNGPASRRHPVITFPFNEDNAGSCAMPAGPWHEKEEVGRCQTR